jgi:3-oxoadipate enol-lactonase
MRFQAFGDGKRVLFLLHAAGLDSSMWAECANALPSGYRVIAPDFRGHGSSSMPNAPFSLLDLASDVVALTEVIGCTKIGLVGSSLGGMVAQEIAAARPDLVRGLVLMGTAFTLDSYTRVAMLRRATRALDRDPSLPNETIRRWVAPETRRERFELVQALERMLTRTDSVVHAYAWQAIAGLDLTAQIASIRCPTLVVRGSDDAACSEEGSRELARRTSGNYLELQHVGHIAPMEQPVRVAAELDRFFRSLLRKD